MSVPPINQGKRPIAIMTPLGDNVLGLRSIVVKEHLSRPFVIEAQFSSLDPDINFDQIVGHPVVVSLTLSAGPPRLWHALVGRFTFVGRHQQYFHYQATLVPWLWALTRSSDCRIFQEQTVPDIVQQVMRDSGSSDFELRLSDHYLKWNYCVQYRETDFNFVSRLLEQEGAAYYFKHTAEKCILVLADDKAAYDVLADFGELYYRPDAAEGRLQDTVSSWTVGREVQPTTYTTKDYNFTMPRTSLMGVAQVSRSHGLNNGKIFDYPGEYTAISEGERLAQVHLDELQVGLETIQAVTSCLAVTAGALFALKDHPRSDQNRDYLVTSVQLYFDAGEFSSDESSAPKAECQFTAIPAEQHFRPARVTPEPIVPGPQTAVVVGPAGEEIHTDPNACVKVQFHWDRYGKADENASCWVRVSQSVAGKNWGAISLPRIGQEVIVEFLEGDPDRPIVTGRVYNGINKAPYPLPDNKTISTFKSNSSKGGQGFNELRFEDNKGEEQIFIHGEKDSDTRIKHDAKTWIGHEQHLIVKKDQFNLIEGNQHSTVGGDRLTKIEGDSGETIKGDQSTAVDGSQQLTLKGDQLIKIDGDANLKSGANINEEAGAKISFKAADIHLKAGSSYAVDGGTIHIKGGMTVVIEAGVQLSLKASGSFVDIGPAGVAISGTMVLINSGGAAESGGGSSPTAPAAPQASAEPGAALEAEKAETGSISTVEAAPEEKASAKPLPPSPAATVLKEAAKDGTPFCEECERARKAAQKA